MPRRALPESKSTPMKDATAAPAAAKPVTTAAPVTTATSDEAAETFGSTPRPATATATTTTTTTSPANKALDARYGRTPRSATRTRWIFWGTAGAFVVVFAAWLVWGGLLGAPAEIEAKDVGHTIVDDRHVVVRFELTTNPGTPVTCALQALNESFGIVGWKIVELGASEERTRTVVESVRTSELAVTGLIYRCWLA